MAEGPMSPTEFGEAFKDFMRQVAKPSAPPESVVARYLQQHFDADPAKLPIVAQEFKLTDHPNLMVALEAYLAVHELLVEGGGLTRCLLGANRSEQTN
jgi:hypothetical protein